MKALVWSLLILAGVLWSLFAWIASLLVGWAGSAAAANADWLIADPVAVEWLSWAAGLLASVGQGTIAIVWLSGLGLLVAVPVATALLRRARPADRMLRSHEPVAGSPRAQGSHDLLPVTALRDRLIRR